MSEGIPPSGGKRPITAAERPHVEALGQMLRALRDEAGLTQAQVAIMASLRASTVSAIERGRRRTRRSTLQRLVSALATEHRRDVILDELVETAGPALAPESDFAERVARRRERRERRDLPAAIEATREALAAARRLAGQHPPGHARHEQSREFIASLERDLARLQADLAAAPLRRQWRTTRPPR